MKHNNIDENTIKELRESVKSILSSPRFDHTLGVEDAAVRMGTELNVYNLNEIRAAALLHDITKEYSFEKQLKICRKFGIMLRDDEIACPQILHAITAAAIIPVVYSNLNTPRILSSVRWHTTGKSNMSLMEKIICLSDFIEDGRKYDACIQVRNIFWSEIKICSNVHDKLYCLDKALISSLENTIEHVTDRGGVVNIDTLNAIESLKKSHI